MSKIENGRQAVRPATIRALGQLYDVDASRLDYLLRLAGEANERGWWAAYRDTVPDWFRTYVGLESDALTLWNYESEHVPGLLQTQRYADALIRGTHPNSSDAEIANMVQLRRERQQRLDGGNPPRLHFYLNEAIIRRPVGCSEVMREQLDYLIEASNLDHVTLRIVPFTAGPHPAMAGPFVMMQFPDEDVPAFVYVEHDRGGIYQEDPGDIDRYTFVVDTLDRLALGVEDSRRLLAEGAQQ